MALQINYSYKGLAVPEAYLRVKNLVLTGPKDNLQFQAVIYTDEASATDGSDALEYISPIVAAYALDGADPFAQAYAYLKTLDAYKDAKDILES